MKAIAIGIGAALTLLTGAAGAQSSNTVQTRVETPTVQEKALGAKVEVAPPAGSYDPRATTGSAVRTDTARVGCREITVRTPQPGGLTVIRRLYDCD